jgi:hypothetical protein
MNRSNFDREKFQKLVALAESANDHEALSAIRAAAKLARAAGESLGEAVRGSDAEPTSSIHYGYLGEQLSKARDEIDRLKVRITEIGAEMYEAGRRATAGDLRAALKERKDKKDEEIRRLELELEAYRAECPWPALAENYFAKNSHGPRKQYAYGLILRARTNRLQPEDHAELRRWNEARQKRNRKAAA